MRLPLCALVGLCCMLMPAAARNLDAKFLIERKGKVIGYHKVDVTETEFGTRVDTEIKMKVAFGPIPVFKYDHAATEVWRGDEVVSIVSNTNNNGDKDFVDAKLSNNALMIKGSGYSGPAPQNAIPSSYWNKDIIACDYLINTQTGEIIDVNIETLGSSKAPHETQAEHFKVVGSVALNIWFDGENWVGSNFVIDGEELTYVLVEDEQRFAYLAKNYLN